MSQTVPTQERQINLLLALRHTRDGMRPQDVISQVSGYDVSSPQAAYRMFERDIAVLRDLGITLVVTGTKGALCYRVPRGDALPPLHLSAAQAAALTLAASAWRDGDLPEAAHRALTKLRAVAEPGAPDALPALSLDLAGQQVPTALATAVVQRQVVTFDYASPGQGPRTRRVEPHRLHLSEGAWYLQGVDTSVVQVRRYRLTRITGPVTPVGPPGAFTPPAPAREPTTLVATLALAPRRALALRAQALEAAPATDCPGQGPSPGGTGRRGAALHQAALRAGRDVVSVPYTDPLAFAGLLASYGEGVVVLAPASLRAQVLQHLAGAAALPAGAPDPDGAGALPGRGRA